MSSSSAAATSIRSTDPNPETRKLKVSHPTVKANGKDHASMNTEEDEEVVIVDGSTLLSVSKKNSDKAIAAAAAEATSVATAAASKSDDKKKPKKKNTRGGKKDDDEKSPASSSSSAAAAAATPAAAAKDKDSKKKDDEDDTEEKKKKAEKKEAAVANAIKAWGKHIGSTGAIERTLKLLITPNTQLDGAALPVMARHDNLGFKVGVAIYFCAKTNAPGCFELAELLEKKPAEIPFLKVPARLTGLLSRLTDEQLRSPEVGGVFFFGEKPDKSIAIMVDAILLEMLPKQVKKESDPMTYEQFLFWLLFADRTECSPAQAIAHAKAEAKKIKDAAAVEAEEKKKKKAEADAKESKKRKPESDDKEDEEETTSSELSEDAKAVLTAAGFCLGCIKSLKKGDHDECKNKVVKTVSPAKKRKTDQPTADTPSAASDSVASPAASSSSSSSSSSAAAAATSPQSKPASADDIDE